MTFKEFFNEYVEKSNKFGLVKKSKDDPTYPKGDTLNRREYYDFNPSQYKAERESDKTSDWKQQLQHALKYHGMSTTDFKKFPSDGSLLYRGHKSLNPFELGPDAKAEGGTYFTNNISYAFRVYSSYASKNSDQIGQKSLNTLQHNLKTPSRDNTRDFDVPLGYITAITPKNPEEIIWYQNFGYEMRNRGNMDTRGRPISREQVARTNDAETVIAQEQASKIRTYVIYNEGYNRYKLLSFNVIKKNYPELYQMMAKAEVS